MVGSLLRTAAAQGGARQAREGRDHGRPAEGGRGREIEKIIRKQEEIGLQLATDGEFRRSWWHFDFFGMLDGVELVRARPRHPVPRRADQGAEPRASPARSASRNHPMLEHFKFLKAHTKVMPKMTIPAPPVLHFRAGQDGDRARASIPTSTPSSTISARPTARRSRRSTTPAAATCSSTTRSGPISARRRSWRRRASAATNVDQLAGHLRAHHQHGARRQARRHDDHHACLPRQFPLDLDLRGRLRAGGRDAARQGATTTATSSNTTPSAPAASSRCASCPRATRSWCSASSPPRAARWRRRTTSSAASTRRPSSRRSSSSASRRNAASPRPRRATCWPRRSSGRSCA